MDGMALIRCICNETRFEILFMLRGGGASVGAIASGLELDQPLVSHHLRTLRECGILSARADGRSTIYEMASPEIARVIDDIVVAGEKINGLCDAGCGA